jgi:hypothetical protein
MEYLREEERGRSRRVKDGIKVAGIICAAAGVATTIVLSVVLPPEQHRLFLIGLIPATVGVVLYGAAFVIGPKSPA